MKDFKNTIKEIKYVPKSKRNKKFWKLTTDTLDKMCKESPIFTRGMFSVIVSECQDTSVTEVRNR